MYPIAIRIECLHMYRTKFIDPDRDLDCDPDDFATCKQGNRHRTSF